jgi:hypothetical protein
MRVHHMRSVHTMGCMSCMTHSESRRAHHPAMPQPEARGQASASVRTAEEDHPPYPYPGDLLVGGARGGQRCQPRSAAGAHCSWWSGARLWRHPRRWLRRCGAAACTARSRRRRLRASPAAASQAGCGPGLWRAAAQQSSSSAVSKRWPGLALAGPRKRGWSHATPGCWLRSTPAYEHTGARLPALAVAYVRCMPTAQRPGRGAPPDLQGLQRQHACAHAGTCGGRSLRLTDAAEHCRCTHAPGASAPALELANATPGHSAAVVLTAALAAAGAAAGPLLPAAPECNDDGGGAAAAAAAAVPPKKLKPGESGSGACAEPPCSQHRCVSSAATWCRCEHMRCM